MKSDLKATLIVGVRAQFNEFSSALLPSSSFQSPPLLFLMLNSINREMGHIVPVRNDDIPINQRRNGLCRIDLSIIDFRSQPFNQCWTQTLVKFSDMCSELRKSISLKDKSQRICYFSYFYDSLELQIQANFLGYHYGTTRWRAAEKINNSKHNNNSVHVKFDAFNAWHAADVLKSVAPSHSWTWHTLRDENIKQASSF